MAKLDVSGSFLITIGHGEGEHPLPPRTWVVISIGSQDGHPKVLNFPDDSDQGPANIFVALSAFDGAAHLPLRIVEVRQLETGFYAFRVEDPEGPLEIRRPSTLGIVINDGTDRGQALVCSCGAAYVTPWFGDHR